MKKKEIIKKIPKTPAEIKKLTEAQFKTYSIDEKLTIFNNAVAAMYKEEEEGHHTGANKIREQIALICKHLNLEGGGEDIRRQDWDNNHLRVTNCIRSYLINDNYTHLPTITTISEKTKLSRQTVNKHLREGIANSFHQERLKYFEYLTTDVLTKMYKLALQGNVSAGRIFLENVYKAAPATNIKQQNNYLHINNTRIDEVTVNELPESARLQIENIITQYSKKTA